MWLIWDESELIWDVKVRRHECHTTECPMCVTSNSQAAELKLM